MQRDVAGLAGLARRRSDVETALAEVDVAEAQTAELAAADAADEQGHDDRAVAVAGLAVAGGREEPQELLVGERAARLVLDARRADVLEHACAVVALDAPLGEERREAAQCLPRAVRGLRGDRRAAMVEVRVHDARLDVFDARGAAELRRDPAVIEPELQAVVVLRRLGQIVAMDQEALADLLEGGLLVTQGRPPDEWRSGPCHSYFSPKRRTDRRACYSRPIVARAIAQEPRPT